MLAEVDYTKLNKLMFDFIEGLDKDMVVCHRVCATLFVLCGFDGGEIKQEFDEDTLEKINALLPKICSIDSMDVQEGMWYKKIERFLGSLEDFSLFLTDQSLATLDKMAQSFEEDEQKEVGLSKKQVLMTKVSEPTTCKLADLSCPGFPAKKIANLFGIVTLAEMLHLIQVDRDLFFERLGAKTQMGKERSEKCICGKLLEWGITDTSLREIPSTDRVLDNKEQLLLLVNKMSVEEAGRVLRKIRT